MSSVSSMSSPVSVHTLDTPPPCLRRRHTDFPRSRSRSPPVRRLSWDNAVEQTAQTTPVDRTVWITLARDDESRPATPLPTPVIAASDDETATEDETQEENTQGTAPGRQALVVGCACGVVHPVWAQGPMCDHIPDDCM